MDEGTMRDYISDLLQERGELYSKVRQLEEMKELQRAEISKLRARLANNE